MRIGLTGGIAAGKSTVASRLRVLGAIVIDYDELSREVVASGSPGLQSVAQAFGQEAIDPQSSGLRRAWLANKVFAQGGEVDRQRLNAIIHPLVFERAQAIESGIPDGRIVVHDVPLLADVLDSIPMRFAHIVTVEAPDEMRIARMVNVRHMTRAQAVARIASQSSRQRREAIADVVIDASQPIEHMFECVDKLYARWASQEAGCGRSH